LFEIKIKDLAITECAAFSDFDGADAHDFDLTTDFIRRKFEDIDSYKGYRNIYVHLTCAMDDKNIQNVFNDVTRIMLQEVKKAMSKNNLL